MSAPTGSAASNWTDEASPEMPPQQHMATSRPRSGYLHALALRREALAIRRQIVYGLVMGWVMLLVSCFIYFCVPSKLDGLWSALMALGALHLATAVIVPQCLYWPERIWIKLACWQGWVIMTALLTIIYFALIWPAGAFSRRRTRGFVSWTTHPPDPRSAWQPIESIEADSSSLSTDHYRSLPLLLAGVIGFFFRRGNYLLVLIVILLVVLGLILYFVQSSALAPFVYTLF